MHVRAAMRCDACARMHRWSTGLWAEALSPTVLKEGEVSEVNGIGDELQYLPSTTRSRASTHLCVNVARSLAHSTLISY